MNNTWIVIYTSFLHVVPFLQAGLLSDIVECSINEGVNRLSVATVVVPRRARISGTPSLLLVSDDVADIPFDTQIGIWREGEGEIFRGYVGRKKRSKAADGTALFTLELFSLGIELQKQNCFRGLRFDNVAFADAVDDVLALAGNGGFFFGSPWSATTTGSFPNITRSFDNMSALEIIQELCKIGNAFWREDSERHLDIRQTSTDSGIVAINATQGSIESEFALITSLNDVEEDSSAVVNRLVPEAKADNDLLLTLEQSTRVTPYTIDSIIVANPSVVDVDAAGGQTNNDPIKLVLESLGDNRVQLFVIRFGDAAGANVVNGISVGGRPMVNTGSGIGGAGNFQQGWVAFNQPKGESGISMISEDPTVNYAMWGVSVSLRDVFQIPSDISSTDWVNVHQFPRQQTTNVSASYADTVNPTEEGDLLVIVVTRPTNAAATSNDGSETLIHDEVILSPGGTGTANRRVFVFTKPCISSSTSIQINFASSGDQWMGAVFRVRPAKVWYIEDTSSQGNYGVREAVIPLGTFIKLSSSSIVNIANAMYDYASDFLAKHSTPALFYDFTLAHIPASPLDWFCGDTMRVVHQDEDEQIDEDLIVVERVQQISSDGVRRWQLTYSDKIQFRQDEQGIWILEQLKSRVAATQFNQA